MTRAKSPYNQYRIIDNFDEIILMAIIKLESIAYGINIFNLVNIADGTSGGTGLSQTRVYAALHLLWKRDLVTCRLIRIDGVARKCRVYTVNSNGIAVLNRLKGIRNAIEKA